MAAGSSGKVVFYPQGVPETECSDASPRMGEL